MPSLRCKDCFSSRFLFTPEGLACESCGSHTIQAQFDGDIDVGLALSEGGQIDELERLMNLVDGRYEAPGVHGLGA